jgi:uncharacterized membrane protein (UPF0127 family)
MWFRGSVALMLVLAALASCGYGEPEEATDAPAAEAPPGAPEFPKGRALIDTGDESLLIDVEVAETDQQRSYGLMNRESLPDDQGMVFVFFRDTQGPFWMKDTLIPLSIAFFDINGEILEILDMKPCKEDPCPLYDPGVSYRGALEVNEGAFERWGVEEGDLIRLNR